MAFLKYLSVFYLAFTALVLQGGSSLATVHERQSSSPQECIQTSNPSFSLTARYKDDPSSTIGVRVIDVNTIPKVGYSILSACATCYGSWSYNTLQDGGLLPKSTTNPYMNTVSFSLVEGESPSFVSIQYPPPALKVYCFTENLVNVAGPQILAANFHADLWSLCPNSTASGRLDVIWSPLANHAHYSLSSCRDVYLEQV